MAYILSANINRRHMTKGQRAMAVAMIYPKSEGRGKRSILNIEFSRDYLVKARTVLEVLPELAKQVLDFAQLRLPLNLPARYGIALGVTKAAPESFLHCRMANGRGMMSSRSPAQVQESQTAQRKSP